MKINTTVPVGDGLVVLPLETWDSIIALCERASTECGDDLNARYAWEETSDSIHFQLQAFREELVQEEEWEEWLDEEE